MPYFVSFAVFSHHVSISLPFLEIHFYTSYISVFRALVFAGSAARGSWHGIPSQFRGKRRGGPARSGSLALLCGALVINATAQELKPNSARLLSAEITATATSTSTKNITSTERDARHGKTQRQGNCFLGTWKEGGKKKKEKARESKRGEIER